MSNLERMHYRADDTYEAAFSWAEATDWSVFGMSELEESARLAVKYNAATMGVRP